MRRDPGRPGGRCTPTLASYGRGHRQPRPSSAPATRRATAAAAARALQPREEQLGGLRRSVETYAARITLLQDELVQHETALTRLPERIEQAREQHAAALGAPAALAGRRRRRRPTCSKRVAASAQHAALVPQLADARAALAVAVDEVHLLTEQWLHLREQRLEGMAAEMAQTLVVGGGCPVCGSEHHPHPAQSRRQRDRRRGRAAVARKAVDDAEAGRLAREEHVRDLTTRIALAELLAGTGPGQVSAELEPRPTRRSPGCSRSPSRPSRRSPPGCAPWSRSRTSSPAAARPPASRSRAWWPPRQAQRSRSPRSPRRSRPQLWDTDGPRPGHPRRRASPPSRTACDEAIAAPRAGRPYAHDEAARAEQAWPTRWRGRLPRRRRRPRRPSSRPTTSTGSREQVRAHEAARLAARQAFDDLGARRGRRRARAGPRPLRSVADTAGARPPSHAGTTLSVAETRHRPAASRSTASSARRSRRLVARSSADLDADDRAVGVRRRAARRTTGCRCGSPPTSWPTGSPRSSTRPTSGWPG